MKNSIRLALPAALLALASSSHAALIGHWEFDENTGTTTADSSTNNNTATVAGDATPGSWVTGVSGSAYDLEYNNGTPSRFELADSSDLQVTGAVTVSAWVKPNGVSDFGVIAGIDQTGGAANDMYSLKTRGSGSDEPFWQVTGVSSTVTLEGPDTLFSTLSNNGANWVHVVGVYDPTGFVGLYVNGGLVDSLTTGVPTAMQSIPATDFQIGTNASDGGRFGLRAAVDDVQVYNEALSQSDVTFLFNNPGTAVPEPSSLALIGLSGLALLRRRRA